MRSERDDKGTWRGENWQIITKARGEHFVSPCTFVYIMWRTSVWAHARAHRHASKRASKVQHRQVVTEITRVFWGCREMENLHCARPTFFCWKHIQIFCNKYVLPCIYKNGCLYMIKKPFTVVFFQGVLLLNWVPRWCRQDKEAERRLGKCTKRWTFKSKRKSLKGYHSFYSSFPMFFTWNVSRKEEWCSYRQW